MASGEPMTVDMQTAYNADEEVADTSPIDEETKDVNPQEPATDITQLIGGETMITATKN